MIRISNTTFDGKGVKTYLWAWVFELLHFIFGTIKLNNCGVRNFHFDGIKDLKRYHLARFIIQYISSQELDYELKEIKNLIKLNTVRNY